MPANSVSIAMICTLLLSLVVAADPPPATQPPLAPEWGKIEMDSQHPGTYRLVVDRWPDSGKLDLPPGLPHLMSGQWRQGDNTAPVEFEFNADATMRAILPVDRRPPMKEAILQTAEKTQQFADGRILFHAADAKVIGATAKLETHPGNARIGFWSNAEDSVTWNYDATRWGRYQALLTYSNGSPKGSEIELEFGGEKLRATLNSTGSWYRYTTLNLGSLYLAKGGKTTLTIRCTKLVGPAVMNLKGVSLLPACEGTPPIQADDGSITLHSRDSTVEGTVLRYEPDPKKLTLGYWVKASDAGLWRFTAKQPGEFEVEVLQGCGTGQGGSDARVTVAGQSLDFVVDDTGHFQNFKPRVIGKVKLEKPGTYELRIQPQKIAKSAAMDIRQVRLLPVKK